MHLLIRHSECVRIASRSLRCDRWDLLNASSILLSAGEALKQMTELEQLRELVRSAEAAEAEALSRPKGLARNPLNPKIVGPLASPHLRDLPNRLRRPDQPSGG